MPEVKPEIQTFAKIKVIGVGGAGGAAVNRMIQSQIKGVEFIVVDDDLQALYTNLAQNKVHIGKGTTRGLGAGMNPAVGRKAAEESQDEIRGLIQGADMVFITCGGGGGTGSGAGPKIAEFAKEIGALTVAVITKPFSFEGAPRKRIAEEAIKEFKGKVDTLITIPNDRIWQIIDKKTPLIDAFMVVDEVLRQGVQGISELITLPGLINVDFADVKTIMSSSGSALMGMGEASGDNRAIEAAKAAIASPLLELSIDGARGILFTITGGRDLTMYEVSEAAKTVTESVDSDARIIFGAVIDPNLKDQLRITVVATGFDEVAPQGGHVKLPGGAGSGSTPNYFAPLKKAERVERVEKREEDKFNFDAKILERETLEPRQPDPDRIKPEDVFPSNKNNNAANSSNDDTGDDEDLEIPAFIRRKMM